ncbi:hypothetical protein [Nocardia sp. NPDC049707]|uniref:hypothetical protein n=1 Tax=Nocardia sp. NPDC049707 TaxID=3154735 RepID=UPI003449CB8C
MRAPFAAGNRQRRGSFVGAGVGIAQRAVGSADVGQMERVVPVQADVAMDERR